MRKHYRSPLLQTFVHRGRRIWCNCQHCGCWWFESWNPPSRRGRWADKRCPLKDPQLPHMMLLLEERDRKDRAACSTLLVRSGWDWESSVSVSVLISIHELIANCWCILPRSAMIISVLCYKKCFLAKIASSQTYFDPPKHCFIPTFLMFVSLLQLTWSWLLKWDHLGACQYPRGVFMLILTCFDLFKLTLLFQDATVLWEWRGGRPTPGEAFLNIPT